MIKEKEKKACFTLRMTKKVHKKFRFYCLEQNTNMTKEILKLIEKVLAKQIGGVGKNG